MLKLKQSKKPGVVYSKRRQVGKSNALIDALIPAIPPGKRISKSGKIYYEYRKNRSDLPPGKI